MSRRSTTLPLRYGSLLAQYTAGIAACDLTSGRFETTEFSGLNLAEQVCIDRALATVSCPADDHELLRRLQEQLPLLYLFSVRP